MHLLDTLPSVIIHNKIHLIFANDHDGGPLIKCAMLLEGKVKCYKDLHWAYS